MSPNPPSLPYEEPGIVTILVLSSFLLLLNAANYLLDKLVYCGLIGQILVGVAWGQPGAGWLSEEVQDAVMQLGYLGLILLVYEGGQICYVWPRHIYTDALLQVVCLQTSKLCAPTCSYPPR